MEELDRALGCGIASLDEDENEETHRSSLFTQLKPYCIGLLELLQSPNKRHPSVLPELLHFLRKSPSSALQPFFDYTLFPLLLLLDAAVACRSQQKVYSEEKNVKVNVQKTPLKVSDRVAEGVLQCLDELLNKCHLGSIDQMVVVLKKLTYGALLTPSEAAEEFREGVIRCFRTLLLSVHPCLDESCSCKQSVGFPSLLAAKDMQASVTRSSKYGSEPHECLLAFLQSQAASAAVGHWLSLLLNAADSEAARGHHGSAKLRINAFLTLRVLVAKVGTADALAFFLPGVVSQFAKVLHVSKTMISGAAGSVEAIDQAIRGLAEYLMIVLHDDANLSGLDMSRNADFNFNKDKSMQSIMEELRHLPSNVQGQAIIAVEDSSDVVDKITSKSGLIEKRDIESGSTIGSLHVNRTKEWIKKTSSNVDKLISATFLHICVHPSKKVRQGLLAAIQGLLSKCSYTLKESRLILLECLCVLVCDDSEEVSAAAQEFLEYLLSPRRKHHVEDDVVEIFNRLLEKLPKVVLGSENSSALSHAQQLLVVIYYSGPQLVVDHLRSPIAAARFLDIFALCLSQNSVFAGSLDKYISARPSSIGYLHSVAELEARFHFISDDQAIMKAALPELPKFPGIQDKEMQYPLGNAWKDYELPRVPPWVVYVGSQKLYQALAGILRLVGLSSIADFRSEGFLSVVTDIPLGYLRTLISEVRTKEYSNESWQSWYYRTGSGQLLRQASTAACMLNEMIFGVSNQAVAVFARMFKSRRKREELHADGLPYKLDHSVLNASNWKVCQESVARSHLIECIGSILHEYLSPEVWELPLEHKPSLQHPHGGAEDITLHFFRDTAMLHQVIIDGIGIFNMCLGKDFASSGFLHSSLYLLLENLVCSNFQIRSASDSVLHILAATSGYPTVGHLVLANSDYVIDSLCRQLRHLDLNPHVPNVLAAMLSYIGIADKILPLLEEPIRAVSLELEILGRHQHPNLTIPFLKAVAEIAKASKIEACSMPTQAESYFEHVQSKMAVVENKAMEDSVQISASDVDTSPMKTEAGAYFNEDVTQIEEWENILFKLNDSKRYRRTVASIVASCLTSAIPLLASVNQAACLVALDIIEDGIMALSKVEAAYKYEKGSKELIEQIVDLCSYHHLRDTLDVAEESADENRLLPAMNKIWPFLVICVRNKNPVAVRRCFDVVNNVVQICGGDFFSRRFYTDGSHFWKLLTTSPFQKKPFSQMDKTPLQLPYRNAPILIEDSMSEATSLKVQVALLNMIANLSRNKRSASALEVVLKKVSGLVVGIACSGVVKLRDASLNALMGLASIDSDLVWLLLADVYYSLKKKDLPSPPISDLPEICRILPPSSSAKEYVYVQYGGQSYGFDVDFASVEIVFNKLNSEVFTLQM